MELENTEQQGQDEAEVGLTDQPVDTQAGDSAEPAAVPEPEIEIERNGQVVKVKMSEAKEYAQKGYDYTQKTQELARERETLRPYQELASYLQTNPDKATQIYNLLAEQAQGVDPVQQKVSYLENVTNQLIQQNAQEKLNTMLNTIHSDEKYNGLFKDKDMEDILLSMALQTKQTDESGLRGVADKIHSKWLKKAVEAEKKGEKKVIDNLNSPTRKGETGTGTFAPPKNFDPSKASWKDISKHALDML